MKLIKRRFGRTDYRVSDLSLSTAAFVKCVDCRATLERLVGNLSGFLYRRRLDPRWTMEFVSAGSRDITGYEPHRFIANASIAFGDLIARSDWERVNERVRLAVLHRQRATVEYLIRTAHGAWLQVEDRFTPVVNAAGKALAIEGLIDRARCSTTQALQNHQKSRVSLPSATLHP